MLLTAAHRAAMTEIPAFPTGQQALYKSMLTWLHATIAEAGVAGTQSKEHTCSACGSKQGTVC